MKFILNDSNILIGGGPNYVLAHFMKSVSEIFKKSGLLTLHYHTIYAFEFIFSWIGELQETEYIWAWESIPWNPGVGKRPHTKIWNPTTTSFFLFFMVGGTLPTTTFERLKFQTLCPHPLISLTQTWNPRGES